MLLVAAHRSQLGPLGRRRRGLTGGGAHRRAWIEPLERHRPACSSPCRQLDPRFAGGSSTGPASGCRRATDRHGKPQATGNHERHDWGAWNCSRSSACRRRSEPGRQAERAVSAASEVGSGAPGNHIAHLGLAATGPSATVGGSGVTTRCRPPPDRRRGPCLASSSSHSASCCGRRSRSCPSPTPLPAIRVVPWRRC